MENKRKKFTQKIWVTRKMKNNGKILWEEFLWKIRIQTNENFEKIQKLQNEKENGC